MKELKLFTRNDQSIFKVPPSLRALVKRAVKEALKYEGFDKNTEVSVTFTDNKGICELNREYRNIDRETDVLSFPMYEGEELNDLDNVTLGDIVLSLEKAKEQAESYEHSFEREVAFLTVHSVLHLLGYDHERSEDEEKDMFFRQEEILKNMDLTR